MLTEDDLCCKRNDRDTGHLADVRHGTAGTRVDLDDVYLVVAHDELDVDQSDDMQLLCQLPRVVLDHALDLRRNALCRINGDTVSRNGCPRARCAP